SSLQRDQADDQVPRRVAARLASRECRRASSGARPDAASQAEALMPKYDAATQRRLDRDEAVAVAKAVRAHVQRGNCGNAASWLDQDKSRIRRAMKKSTIQRLHDLVDLCYVKHDPRGPGADSVVHRRLRARGLIGRR